MRVFDRKIVVFGLLLSLLWGVVAAEPWAAPGDRALRHDIQLLGEYGVLPHPVTTWPLSWPDIAAQLKGFDQRLNDQSRLADPQVAVALSSAAVQAALQRTRWRLRQQQKTRQVGFSGGLKLANDAYRIRGFTDSARGNYEANSTISWMGEDTALKLSITLIENDEFDEDQIRLDGSYAAAVWGNWMFSLGAQDRWWGPGWRSSIILSNNARPVPAVAVQRKVAKAFENKWLSWIGPWQFNTFLGQLESDRVQSNALLWGMRGTFKPVSNLEIGLSRTLILCGEGRSCGVDSFGRAFIGNDNNTTREDPSDQLAGYDLRWTPQIMGQRFALYTQLIGEDEAGGLPAKFLGQFGVEATGAGGLTWLGNGQGSHSLGNTGSWRAYIEYVDLAANFIADQPIFNVAYSHTVYRSGHTYRGRALGHTLDSDSRWLEFGGLLVSNRWSAHAALAFGEINRDGSGRNSLSTVAEDVSLLQLEGEYFGKTGRLGLGLQWLSRQSGARSATDVNVSLTWQRGF